MFTKSGFSTMFSNKSDNSYAKFGQYRNGIDKQARTLYFTKLDISDG